MVDDLSIGKQIKKARNAKKLTQKQLASMLGVATGTIQQYELGKRQPRYEQLQAIADVLQVDIIDLFDPLIQSTFKDIYYKNQCTIKEIIKKEYGIDGPFVVLEIVNDDDGTITSILSDLEKLNALGIVKAAEYINDLAGNPMYKKIVKNPSEEATEPPAPVQPSTDTPNEENPPEGQPGPADGK